MNRLSQASSVVVSLMLHVVLLVVMAMITMAAAEIDKTLAIETVIADDVRKHEEFVQRMVSRGYTPRQVRRLVEWYMRVKKSG